MSWVVLEGPDGTGKTTIAEQLREAGYLYQHAGPEDTLPVLAARMAKLQALKYVVWDRCHLGEAVYGSLDRGTTPSRGWWNLIEAFLLEKRATCILMTHQYADKVDYLGRSGRDRFEAVTAAYHRVIPTSHLHWRLAGAIDGRLVSNLDATDPWEWRLDAEGLGGFDPLTDTPPRTWVLGEQQNPLANVPWPFATRCGIELVWPMIQPRYQRISNALRANLTLDATELHERWQGLGRPRVVALGRVAENACQRAGIFINHGLTHPQYALRFHAGQAQVYRQTLETALA